MTIKEMQAGFIEFQQAMKSHVDFPVNSEVLYLSSILNGGRMAELNISRSTFKSRKNRSIHALLLSWVGDRGDDFISAATEDFGEEFGAYLRSVKGLLPSGANSLYYAESMVEEWRDISK